MRLSLKKREDYKNLDNIRDKRIVVLGGGTGSFVILSALKSYTKYLTAIVNMVDDGGSTGVLRDELGTLPSGDVRQCLVALSDTSQLRDLFSYRFSEGTFEGHSFGNLFLTALEKTTGSFAEAVKTAGKVLRVNGRVVPATLDNVRLKMEWPELSIILQGERVIDTEDFKNDPRKANLSLVPTPQVNPAAIEAIEKAGLVVVAPGDLYTSLGPLLIIDGIGEALRKTSAKVVYMCNLVTKHGQTDGFSVSDHAAEIERFAGAPVLDFVVYNKQQPDKDLIERYEQEQSAMVEVDTDKLNEVSYEAIGADLLGELTIYEKSDKIGNIRSLIRHNMDEVAEQILRLI